MCRVRKLNPASPLRSCLHGMLFISILLIYNIGATAQSLPNRRYTTRDGLVADRVTVIAQDHEGYMWMGSLFGLSRYDGSRFTTVRLPAQQQHKYVTSLLAAHKKMYAGFLFGGGLIEYEKGDLRTFLIPAAKKPVNNDIVGLFEDATGILLINTVNEVYHFENGKFRYLFTPDTSSNTSITALVRDAQQRIWVGTSQGLLLFEKGILHSSPVAKGSVLFLRKTHDSMMVVRTEGKHTFFELFAADLTKTVIKRTAPVHHIPFAGVQSNSFWGIDESRNLFRLSQEGKTQAYALPGHATELKYLFADRENNLWMANDPGVLKISNVPALSYEFEELAPGGADVAYGKNVIWCTNSKHLYAIRGDRIQKMPDFRDDRNRGYLGSMITDDQDNLWINSWSHGLWKLSYKDDKLVRKELFMTYQDQPIDVNCFTRDEQGIIWAGGSNGIFRIEDGKIAGYFRVTENDKPVFITAIAKHPFKNEIWAGRNAEGLIKITYTTNGDQYTFKISGRATTPDGLTDPSMRSLCMDTRDNLWIGTRLGGIFRMRTDASGKYIFENYSRQTGLTCGRVTDISEEKGKAVWFATCDGVFRFSFANNSWQRFSVSDGLLAAEIFAIGLDTTGKQVWSVSGQGITGIDYSQNATEYPAPLINITQVSVLGKEDASALSLTHPKKLSADENAIGFTFAGTSYIDEKKIRYKYMLEGYEKDWSVPVANNNVNYASLPFGQYTFKVLASNGGRWSEHPATFSFQVIRPFYKSYWFMAIVACLLGLSFYFIRVYRLKQKLKLEKLRVNIARDLHDDIGSALGSINLLSENATRRLATNASVTEVAGVFQKIGYSAQNMLDSMDDIIWTINPEKDSIEDLLIRMREFAIPLLEAKNIAFDMDMQAAEVIRPSLEIKRNIYLVFKEAISNVVRHSDCTEASIKARFNAKSFYLQISDNGKGFDERTPNSRNGINNMRKRAHLSGAKLEIETGPGSGTTVRFFGNIR